MTNIAHGLQKSSRASRFPANKHISHALRAESFAPLSPGIPHALRGESTKRKLSPGEKFITHRVMKRLLVSLIRFPTHCLGNRRSERRSRIKRFATRRVVNSQA